MRKQNKETKKQTNKQTIFKNISTKGSSKEATLCSLIKRSKETATFTRRETKTCHRGNHLTCRCPSRKPKLSTELRSGWVVLMVAEEWPTPTKAASEPQLYNCITIVISPPLFIYVYIKVLQRTGTRHQGKVLALLFAASGRLDWSYTGEKHHEKRHHKVSRSEIVCCCRPDLTMVREQKSLSSLARTLEQLIQKWPPPRCICPFPLHRERGEKEAEEVLVTAIPFQLPEKETSPFLKRNRETQTLETKPS